MESVVAMRGTSIGNEQVVQVTLMDHDNKKIIK